VSYEVRAKDVLDDSGGITSRKCNRSGSLIQISLKQPLDSLLGASVLSMRHSTLTTSECDDLAVGVMNNEKTFLLPSPSALGSRRRATPSSGRVLSYIYQRIQHSRCCYIGPGRCNTLFHRALLPGHLHQIACGTRLEAMVAAFGEISSYPSADTRRTHYGRNRPRRGSKT